MGYESIKRLLPQGVSDQRSVVFVDKAFRDAELLRKHAHYVIVIDSEAGELYCREFIDNSKHGYIANVIAVLAPVSLFDGRFVLEQGLVLEIGLSRGRPYTQAEVKLSPLGGEGRQVMKKRNKLRDITSEELSVVWEKIRGCLHCEAEKRMSTRLPNNYTLRGRDLIHEDGVRFTVSQSDKVLYWKVRIEDDRERVRRVLLPRAQWIALQLRRYKETQVNGKRFKNLKGVRAVANALFHMRKYKFATDHVMRQLFSLIPKDVIGVFREALEAHGMEELLRAEERDIPHSPWRAEAEKLPALHGGHIIVRRKQGKKMLTSENGRKKRQIGTGASSHPHAQGCIVGEYYLDERQA